VSGPGPGPLAAVDRPESRGPRCPRCDSPTAGDFKFCPTCAFRLRTSLADPAPAAPPARPTRLPLFLAGLAGAVLVAALVGVGLLLTRPEWFGRRALRAAPPSPDLPLGERHVYTVADIPDQLIGLDANGYAYSYPLADVDGLSDDEKASIEQTLRSTRQATEGDASLDAIVPYRFQILRTEVTRGEYEEFLRDIDEHRDRVPTIWLEWDRKSSPLDLDLLAHVPPSWIRSGAGTASAEWGVDDTAKNLPVAQVSYVDAIGFCEWAGKRLNLALSLPFEMEWIRAARPQSTPEGEPVWTAWPWGVTSVRLTFACNSLSYWLPNPGQAQIVDFPYPEGNGGATAEGVLCLAGNVREWAVGHDVRVLPRLLDHPPQLTWETTPQSRRSRTAPACGGSFRTGIDDCQVDSRETYLKTERRDDVGFRIVVRPQ